jgi:hypothetical protein
MAETEFFWQGGRKIAVQKDASTITIHATSEANAQAAASRAGVQLESLRAEIPGLVRATVAQDRERSCPSCGPSATWCITSTAMPCSLMPVNI